MRLLDLSEVVYTGGDVVDDLALQNQARYGGRGISFQVLTLVEILFPRSISFCVATYWFISRLRTCALLCEIFVEAEVNTY